MKTKPLYIKEFSYKRIRQILTKRIYYLPLVYILINIGFMLSLVYSKKLSFNLYYPIIFVLLPYSCLFLQRIHANFFQNKDDNFNEKFLKIYFIIGYLVMIILPVLTSFFIFSNFKYGLTFDSIVILMFFSFLTSLILNNRLKYRLLIDYPNDINETILQYLLFIGIIISIIIICFPKIIISVTNMFNLDISEIGTLTNIAIAIIVLCATLSSLSFTYCTTLKNNKKNYSKMRKNGEGYFISTILSMLFLILIYVSSLITRFINLPNQFKLNLMEYIFINIYTIALIFLVILATYIFYYMIISSSSTLKILGFIK